MSKFLTKCVRKYEDGRYLCSFSASPEQILSGWWVDEHKYQQYIQTVGCSFDQQMIYENAKDDLECSSVLGVSDDIIEKEREQLELYEPVRIGYDGQIKEYDEELLRRIRRSETQTFVSTRGVDAGENDNEKYSALARFGKNHARKARG